MSDIPSLGDTSRYMTLIALVGAANLDATQEQRERLKGEVLPMLRDHLNPLRWVVERVFEIMGPDWNPVDAGNGWGTWLMTLLAERRRGGVS